MSYIYIYMENLFLMFLDHTQRRSLLRSWVRIPPGAWIFVCCECRVLSGRGLCDELITRPEESYRLCCVVVCDLETSRMGAPYMYDISRLRVNDMLQLSSKYTRFEVLTAGLPKIQVFWDVTLYRLEFTA